MAIELHAKLSPSGAHRWMACPGSVVLEAAYPNTSSSYADEGSAAHTIAAYCLMDKTDAVDYVGEVVCIGDSKIKVTKDMARHVQTYVDYVRERAEGRLLYVEQQVPIGHLTGEDGATGTADAIIVDTANRALIVVDLKFGMGVAVEATENPQMQMYALGAIEDHSVLTDFDTVEMVIHQPRIGSEPSVWVASSAALTAFGNEVGSASCNVSDAFADGSRAEHFAREYLQPGAKQCRFCRAKATCPALRSEMLEVMGAPAATAEDFAQFVPEPVDSTTGDNWLPVAMSKVDVIEHWCKAIRAETERRLLAGAVVDGYKLVEGRSGPRQWIDADMAEDFLKAMKLRDDEIYDSKVISPTSAEKLLKKQNPQVWEKAQAFISRAGGKLSVAPVTDPRPAKAVNTATAADFQQFTTTDN